MENACYDVLAETRGCIEETLAKMLYIKKEGENYGELRELSTQASVALLNLRQINRMILQDEDHVKQETEAAKLPVEFLTTQLKNLLYQKSHYLKAINACKDLKTKYNEIELVSEEELYKDAREEFVRDRAQQVKPHKQMLERLSYELYKRKELCKQRELLEVRKKMLQDKLANQKRFLSSLPQLKALKKASLPLQQQLGIHCTKRSKQHQLAELLPVPLFILYKQILDQKEAFDENIELEIVGSVKDAQAVAYQQAMGNSAVACAESGLRAHLLLVGEKLSIPIGYNLISGMYGEVTYIPRSEYADRETMLTKYAKDVAENGPVVRMEDMHPDFDAVKSKLIGSYQPSKKVAIVNEGASDAIALLGLIRLVDYLSQPNCFGRDRKLQLVVDCGTGTTAIGLALAVSVLRLPWEVVGVMLVGGVQNFRNLGARLLDDFNKMWMQDRSFEIIQAGLERCLKWTDRPRPRKFGKVLEGEIQACQKIARETGILLDPVYTLAAWEVASNLTLSRDREIVMLHTGGTMGLFGLAQRYSSEF